MSLFEPTVEMHPQRWGDPAAAAELPESARGLVELAFGRQDRPAVTDAVPPASALDGALLDELRGVLGAEHVLTDDATRTLRTRGKSTPDLLRARSGDLADAPDAVVRPMGHADVVAVLAWAAEHRVAVVPFGGGTCVTGGLAARRDGFAGLVSLDLVRMKRVLAVDEVSMTATLEPGLRGPEAEALLGEHGLMLGHYPQSFEHASIGGFAATRSSGQSSAGYGRFDAMVVRLTAATPTGSLDLGSSPANAAGPDLRQLLLGSEGAFGVITSVTVRVRRVPEVTSYEGWRWPSFDAGSDAMRTLAQAGLLPTVIRLSDESETAINLADPSSIGGTDDPGCLMITGYEGASSQVAARQAAVTAVLTDLGGTALGTEPGDKWVHGRFNAPYLRDSLLDLGVLVETLETATFWSNRERLYADVKAALQSSLGEGSLVLCHISHVYETGCSLYFTVAARQADDAIAQWQVAKAAASDAMIAAGATITHHHAVGTDHKPWFAREIGDVGVRVLRAVKAELDPAGILNPGVLIP
ncbi:alkyldihydroxyacetonephosphate synthase [Nocardioides sp. BE266]|uniref:FAD-binding oxidoreductase n=1 Tax=Nocardioides sp. BE266 TaxID=2817725 RepID=UPI00285CFE5D|nr:FAD-binding oxidoreductase [Nocardioides sp. BE266]MDR7253222.1 alkyldihydroxyacetonephosphate synthase [Nocardioides sp. BE266]